MSLRMGWAVALPILLGMITASVYVFGELPPGARIAIHFGIDGQPDGWSSASVGVLIIPAAAVFASVLLSVLPYIDPRRYGIERSLPALIPVWMALLIVLAAAHAAILLTALGQPVDVPRLITGALGLLFLVIGNFMGKIRWNYTFGIRTPWTLANERVWDKTHRFAGWLVFLTGAVILAAAALPIDDWIRVAATLLPLPVFLLVKVKSYLLWRTERPQA